MSDNYRFAVIGPFQVPTKRFRGRRIVDFEIATSSVFDAAERQAEQKLRVSNIRSAVGCYVFALKPSGGQVIWPYYVGQSRLQTLSQRVFQLGDKPKTYNAILREYERATPYVYLLPLMTPKHKLARIRSNQPRIDEAEYSLIGMALRANYSLWNIKHRSGMEAFSIDGTPQAWRRDTAPAASFRRMLGFVKRPKVRATGEIEPAPQDVEDLISSEPLVN
jgi:hypothetical protein